MFASFCCCKKKCYILTLSASAEDLFSYFCAFFGGMYYTLWTIELSMPVLFFEPFTFTTLGSFPTV